MLVQTDYRWLKTDASNAAFGYNFEGGMQQYVLMDERVIVDPASGESFLIPVEEGLGSSAVALVEPWACVESSYISEMRRAVKSGGKLLVAVEAGYAPEGVAACYDVAGRPAEVTLWSVEDEAEKALRTQEVIADKQAGSLAGLPDQGFDDIIYFGHRKDSLEALNDKLAVGGIMNVVLCGGTIGEPVSVGIGRIHYQDTRWIGTAGNNAADGYKNVPKNGEVRPGDRVLIIGGGGPMGQMHVIRMICAEQEGLEVTATDLDDHRLEALGEKLKPLCEANQRPAQLVNPQKEELKGPYSHIDIIVPVGKLVTQAVELADEGTIINIFAGIPVPTREEIDLDRYVKQGCFMYGTSGSRLEDMKICLKKLIDGKLDTNHSVDAVSGMAGVIDGLRAVENRMMAGKIVVYPALKDLPLIPLREIEQHYPTVAEKLERGLWNPAAEAELLRAAGGNA